MSTILATTGVDQAAPFLDMVFQQEPNTPNFITVLLPRLGDPAGTPTGEFSIGEVAQGYEKITNMPKLPVQILTDNPGDQHWLGLVDGILVNNRRIQTESSVADLPNGQMVVMYDTGFTFPQVPESVSTAMYGSLHGAQFDSEAQLWVVPCSQELNITFVIGGMSYPIHPMDAIVELAGDNGAPLCVGAVSGNIYLTLLLT